jgi:predicted flap endonuclease-1-like 5' DNA nuclease
VDTTPPFDDELAALERARDRLAARLAPSGAQLPAVIGPRDFQDSARRAALAKLEEALTLLRDVTLDATYQPAASVKPEAFRTVLKVKATTSLSSMIPTLLPVDARDDLTEIRGIDEPMVRRLAALGVTRFRQIADWSPEAVRQVVMALGLGTEITDNAWVDQAITLAASGPKTTPLEPVAVGTQTHFDAPLAKTLKVGAVGLEDILLYIRTTPTEAPLTAGTNSFEPDIKPPTPTPVGTVSPLPVAPLPDAPLGSPIATSASTLINDVATTIDVPLHIDAATRLTELERELQDLSNTYGREPWAKAKSIPPEVDIFSTPLNSQTAPTPQPVSQAPDSHLSYDTSRALIIAPTLQDRLGGLAHVPNNPFAATLGDQREWTSFEDEEADVIIVTKRASRAPSGGETSDAARPDTAKSDVTKTVATKTVATKTPDTSAAGSVIGNGLAVDDFSQSRALVPFSQRTGSPAPSNPFDSSSSDAYTDDEDEATVVIVHQPKVAKLLPELAFFQAAQLPPEERTVQRFLNALNGDRT